MARARAGPGRHGRSSAARHRSGAPPPSQTLQHPARPRLLNGRTAAHGTGRRGPAGAEEAVATLRKARKPHRPRRRRRTDQGNRQALQRRRRHAHVPPRSRRTRRQDDQLRMPVAAMDGKPGGREPRTKAVLRRRDRTQPAARRYRRPGEAGTRLAPGFAPEPAPETAAKTFVRPQSAARRRPRHPSPLPTAIFRILPYPSASFHRFTETSVRLQEPPSYTTPGDTTSSGASA